MPLVHHIVVQDSPLDIMLALRYYVEFDDTDTPEHANVMQRLLKSINEHGDITIPSVLLTESNKHELAEKLEIPVAWLAQELIFRNTKSTYLLPLDLDRIRANMRRVAAANRLFDHQQNMEDQDDSV